jgi:hypothetical protein
MRRESQTPSWWKRFFGAELAPAYVRAETLRRCPDCSSIYGERERYCPGCHTATPEWRYG